MSEKAIISGKTSKDKQRTTMLLFVGIAIASLGLYTMNFKADLTKTLYYITHIRDSYVGFQVGDFFAYGSLFVPTMGVSVINLVLEIIWMGLPIYTIVQFFKTRNSEITVSDSFVSGTHSFGKRANLSVSKITSVGIGKFSSVVIAMGSEKYKFWFIENNEEIVKVISDKIQTKETLVNSSSTATEIQKYKELLDGGVITQEEFDTKKKQLLGL